MLQHLSKGWKIVNSNKKTLITLGLYQLLWTTALFFIIKQIVSPLSRSMPTENINPLASQYFWLEAKFLLSKTDIVMPYIALFVILLLLRMILTPFIQSGLYGTLATSNESGTNNQFLSQLKLHWKPFMMLYWIKAVAILTPIMLIGLPLFNTLTSQYFSTNNMQLPIVTIVLAILWISIVSSLIYSLLLGKVSNLLWQQSISLLLKHSVQLMLVLLTITIITAMITIIFQLTTLYAVGIFSLLLFILVPIIRTFLKAWIISTHLIQFNH